MLVIENYRTVDVYKGQPLTRIIYIFVLNVVLVLIIVLRMMNVKGVILMIMV